MNSSLEKTNQQTETQRSRLVVEVGSAGIPSAFHANRGIKDDEHYVSVNEILRGQPDFAKWERKEYGGVEGFSPLVADARSFPFPDVSVDELIFNNVFGMYSQAHGIQADFLEEASRVLVNGGEIHITEMNTPWSVPEEWFIGGRPDKDNGKTVIANPEYFSQFGLVCTKLSPSENPLGLVKIFFASLFFENFFLYLLRFFA